MTSDPTTQGKSSTAESDQPGVRVLLLDSAENEGVDFLQSLGKQGIKCSVERVSGREPLFKALETGVWDILLVNDQVTSPSADETLAYIGQVKSDVGYVLLSSDPITIDFLANAYKRNIADVVSSHHLEYSCEVFSRAAERSRRNFQLSQLNQEKFELARHRDQLMSGTEEALAYLQDGIHVYANDAYLNMLGYKDMEELEWTPFIDVVSTEMRDKIKQTLLDFQHTVRIKPETESMDLPELYLTAIGDKEAILEVHATFKPVVYDGEDCLQVVLKDKSEMEAKDSSGAGEGLGYPLFITHLDNSVSEAQAGGGSTGQVVHVHGEGFEHYIAGKGFGSLNGKLKALASELKTTMGKGDFLIRFTEKSFLILVRSEGGEAIIGQVGKLLGKFQAALNKEIGADPESPLVVFQHDVIPVSAESESAESLIKSLLLDSGKKPAEATVGTTQGTSAEAAPAAETEDDAADNNVVPFAKKPDEDSSDEQAPEVAKEQPVKPAAKTAATSQPVNKAASKPESAAAAGKPPVDTSAKAESKPAAPTQPEAEAPAAKAPAAKQPKAKDKPPAAKQPAAAKVLEPLDVTEINSALTANSLELYYEPMISVTDIETEYYDLGIYFANGGEKISRERLGQSLGQNPIAGKLDMWALNQALGVIGELYSQGQEYRVLLPMTARSLSEKRLSDAVSKEMAPFALPPGMVVLDFDFADLAEDCATNGRQLDKLRDVGAFICVSGISDSEQVDAILKETKITLARLDKNLVENASSDEGAFKTLTALIEKLHESRIKVAAGEINDSELLSSCCKAKLDLVTGSYIQKTPLALTTDTLSEAIAI